MYCYRLHSITILLQTLVRTYTTQFSLMQFILVIECEYLIVFTHCIELNRRSENNNNVKPYTREISKFIVAESICV